MKKMVFKRVSMTLDLATAQKCRELASQKGQSVSSFVRYLVVEAYAREAAMMTKGAEQRREKCQDVRHDPRQIYSRASLIHG